MTSIRLVRRAAALLGAATLAVAGTHPALAADAAPDKVSVAILSLTSDAGIFIAMERGYFAEQRIQVELTRTTSLADVLSLLATNKLNVATGGATPGLFNAFKRGVSAQIVTDKSSQLPPNNNTGGLMVRRDLLDSGEVKTAADLKGKRIAVNNIQSTSLNYVLRGLASGGLTKNDVKLVEMPFNQFIPALEKKAVDAVMVYTPLNQTIDRMKLGKGLPEGELAVTSKGDSFNIMLYSEDFAKTDAAKRFMVAHLKAQRDYQRAVEGKTDIKEICRIINKYISTMPADCAGMVFTGINTNGAVNLDSLERYQKEWLELGIMKEPADIKAHVNQEFSKYAVSVLGPYQ